MYPLENPTCLSPFSTEENLIFTHFYLFSKVGNLSKKRKLHFKFQLFICCLSSKIIHVHHLKFPTPIIQNPLCLPLTKQKDLDQTFLSDQGLKLYIGFYLLLNCILHKTSYICIIHPFDL